MPFGSSSLKMREVFRRRTEERERAATRTTTIKNERADGPFFIGTHPAIQRAVAGVPGITLDKPQSPLCVALLIDFVKPDDVIAFLR